MANETKIDRRTIHFHSGDARFCRTKGGPRRFTLDPNEVTCENCKARDTFVLSPAAAEYVREIERKHGARS